METKELVNAFRASALRLKKYNQAMEMLKEIEFEDLLYRLSLESECAVPVNHPQYLQAAAITEAKKQGWREALDCFFNFYSVVSVPGSIEAKKETEFNADIQMKNLGYTDEEIANAKN